ncbi:MAG: NAD(P)-dependent alcohol dehydrogenase [Rhodospirillaceae bacterium]|nr:NAD(P)-dependent alcohol dehydrogenase [Rhodospirillaceae bacterium]
MFRYMRFMLLIGIFAAGLSVSTQAQTANPPPSAALYKAIVYRSYGPPSVLHLDNIAIPTPNENQVVIRVRAAAANPLDWHYMRGAPYIMRFQAGLTAPEEPRIGTDVSGVVAAVGSAVTRFKPGDEVFGVARGAFGQYAIAAERRLATKPAELSFETAAAMPVAAVTALQALRDTAQLKPGQQVLINGASGGVGTYAVQIAKALGAKVTAVSSKRNVDLVKSLGADRVIDYTQEDFTQSADRYDVVLDNVGNRSLSEVRSVLKPDGIHILNGGGGPDDNPWITPFDKVIGAFLVSPFVSQRATMMLAEVTSAELGVLTDMVKANQLKSVIDRTFTLADTPQAITYLESGRARGKVVITVPQE